MPTRPDHLRLVPDVRDRTGDRLAGGGADGGDLALLAGLFGVNLVPLLGEVVHGGRWGPGAMGLATAGAILAGRQLWLELRALRRTSAPGPRARALPAVGRALPRSRP